MMKAFNEQCTNHIEGNQYLLTGANLSLYNAASHRGAPGRLSGSALLFVDKGFIPSYNGERGLQSPVVNVLDHANIPEQVRTEDVIPRKLPHYGWNPLND